MEVVETLLGGLKIVQDTALYRFTSDSVLLSRFARAKYRDNVADFCAGSGVVGLHFYALNPMIAHLTLVELQGELAALAKKSVGLNSLEEKCTVLNAAVQSLGREYDDAFSLILCNPPYERAGFENKDDKKAICRKELTLTFAELVEAAYRKLKYGGRFAFVHRADRTAELLFALKSRGLEPKRVQYVSGREGDSPYLVMIEAVKGGKEGTAVLPLLVNAEERMERTFRQGEIVQHFKRELIEGEKGMKYLYEIVGVAHHSETGEPLMVYRALYGERGMCVRPLSMFLSEVDREKYPRVRQKYRFEAVKEE